MKNEKTFNCYEVCDKLGITTYTLGNWYRWESRMLKDGLIEKNCLPIPLRLNNAKGRPRRWTESMIKELKDYKDHLVIGRNGIYGAYSNPNYKKSSKVIESK